MYLLFSFHVCVLYYCLLSHLNLSLYFFTIRLKSRCFSDLYLTLKCRASRGFPQALAHLEELTENKNTSDRRDFETKF